MSNTPAAADDVMKLLDRGYTVMLRRNELGSYTAIALPEGTESVDDVIDYDRFVTDDFTPSQALYRLTEKVTTGRIA